IHLGSCFGCHAFSGSRKPALDGGGGFVRRRGCSADRASTGPWSLALPGLVVGRYQPLADGGASLTPPDHACLLQSLQRAKRSGLPESALLRPRAKKGLSLLNVSREIATARTGFGSTGRAAKTQRASTRVLLDVDLGAGFFELLLRRFGVGLRHG